MYRSYSFILNKVSVPKYLTNRGLIMDESLFQANLMDHGIELSDHQLAQFKQYYELLVEWNQKMNLTAITGLEEVYLKHFFDSLSAAFYYDFSQPLNICD